MTFLESAEESDRRIRYKQELKALIVGREVNRIINADNIAHIFYLAEIPLRDARKYMMNLARNIK